jgi:subtilisin family serine protease
LIRKHAPRLAGLALIAAGTLVPGPHASAADRPGDGELSARLAQLAKPVLRSAPLAAQAGRLGLARGGAGSLVRQGERVVVDVRFERGALAGVAELREAGARIVHASRRYQTVTVAIAPGDLRTVAAVSRVGAVTEVLAPAFAATQCAGLVTSEGDAQLNAGAARADFGLDGAGVTVGILSDSFDRDPGAPTHAGGDVASGDLPGPGNPCGHPEPVGLLDDFDFGGIDEGRAMAQIVHDLAPGARLRFASATSLGSPFAFAANIRALHNAGADVLVDDVIYFDEPFFQEGPIAVAANEAIASGRSYFSAAGNDNLIDGKGRNFASWEAPAYRDSGACPAGVVALSEKVEELEAEEGFPPEGLHPTHCMDFDPGAGPGSVDNTFEITVEAGETLLLDLQWAEPWFGVGTDLDAFLLDSKGDPIEVEGFAVAGVDDNLATQRPLELIGWENESGAAVDVQLAINRFAGAAPRLKLILLQNGGGVSATEYPESAGGDLVGPTIFGHSGAANVIGVGAVRFNNGAKPEDFSSRGPVTNYFGPVTGPAPAAPIPPTPLAKPDLVATDGGATTFFGQPVAGVWRFFGTSAAAPHAAAVAALMKQANPSLSPQQLRLALAATARPVGTFGPNAVGAGLVDAYGAVRNVALPPTVTIVGRPRKLGNDPRPPIEFVANRPVTFACALDGGVPRSCVSPFVPSTRLSEGEHGFVVRATDVAGRSGQSELVSFVVDTRRPRTFFRKKPRKTIRTRHRRAKVVFRFGSNERGVTFICRVDGGLPRFCKRRLVRRFRVGRHVVRVRARDAAGNLDRRGAVYRFKVKRIGR